MLRTESNARIHALATIMVVGAGLACGIDRGEWLAVTLAIMAVWSAEGFNTAIEALCDLVSTETRPEIARAKDVAAGAVATKARPGIRSGGKKSTWTKARNSRGWRLHPGP